MMRYYSVQVVFVDLNFIWKFDHLSIINENQLPLAQNI